MASNGDQDSQREHRPKRARISQNLFWRPINSEQNSPENQTADKQQLHQPGDADGFLQSSVNRGGIPQLTRLHLGQRGVSNFIDQGRKQPQALIQQQPDSSRGKKRGQQSAPDSHTPEIRQTIPDKLARKRLIDRRYRERQKHEKLQTKADLEKLRIENGQLKDERWELKSEVEKLKAENGQLRQECQEMKSYVVKFEAENRYSSRVAQGFGPQQSSTSGFQDVGPSVQPSNINPFEDWSHNRDNGVDEYFTVEEICIRSHKMVENEDRQLMPQPFSIGDHAPINMPEDLFQNEDMQLMPQLSSMGAHASMNMPEDCYTFCPYIPSPMSRINEMLENEDMQFMPWQVSMEGQASINMPEDGYTSLPYIPSPMPNFDEERLHTGKIIIGWLTIIRTVIKWTSLTRKAAERRAQIVELE